MLEAHRRRLAEERLGWDKERGKWSKERARFQKVEQKYIEDNEALKIVVARMEVKEVQWINQLSTLLEEEGKPVAEPKAFINPDDWQKAQECSGVYVCSRSMSRFTGRVMF